MKHDDDVCSADKLDEATLKAMAEARTPSIVLNRSPYRVVYVPWREMWWDWRKTSSSTPGNRERT